MTTLRALDSAIRLATNNESISNKEVDGLIKLAKQAVKNSGSPARTAAAVLERFDAFAKLKYVGGDKRVINKIAQAVETLTDDAKTFSPLGIQAHHIHERRTSRTGGGKSGGTSGSTSGGGKSSGGSVSRPVVRTPSTPVRTGGGKSGGSGRAGGGK